MDNNTKQSQASAGSIVQCENP